MADKENPELTTSRRQFTKVAAGAIIAAPALISLSCRTTPPAEAPKVTPTPSPTTPTKESCFPNTGGGIEEHIPPMGILGGGSLFLETFGEFTKAGSYYEELSPTAGNKLGDITSVIVITEGAASPYVTFHRYSGLPVNSQLLLWYQFLDQHPGNDECIYAQTTFDTLPPSVRIQGGNRTANRPLRMTFPADLDPKDKSRKCKRPHKYRQPDRSGLQGHFRVGQWRLVDGVGNVLGPSSNPFQDNVYNTDLIPEQFSFYIYFDHYTPHRPKSE